MTQQIILKDKTYDFIHHSSKGVVLSIPYALTLGAVNVAGTLYVADPINDSFTDGAFVGVVVGTYHIDKNNIEACSDNGLIKVCVKLDFSARKLQGRLCTRNVFGGGWDCGGWSDIVSW